MARATEFSRLALLGFMLFGAALHAATPLAITGETMGTTWSVKFFPTEKSSAAALQRAVQSRLDELEGAMSTYRDDSEVMRFNRAPSTNWFPVSSDTATVVAAAQRVSETTGGAFDITIAPLVDLWGFGKVRHARQPATNEIAAARALIGWPKLHVRLDPPALRKDAPDLAMDLSGIAKGYAVDAISSLLARAGSTNYLVQIGGEFFARGHGGDGQPWRVGVEDARRPGEILRVVELHNRALSTSGNYRNFHDVGARRLGHIIDPRHGWPVTNELASVSVIAGSSTLADAMATTVFVLGQERGTPVAASNRVECIFTPH